MKENKIIGTAIALLIGLVNFGQNKMPYQLYTKEGKKTTYDKLLKAAEKNEVALFGEYHDNSIVHWLQLEFTKDLAQKKSLVLGAEMIEADNQKQLDQYLKGEINQKQLDSTARLWNNYKTDYKPLVDFAKEKNFRFIATNVPRRYASMVFKKDFTGLNDLTAEEKSWMAPLPIPFDINLPGYKSMLEMMGGHAGEKMPKAQALKDATMAHFILENINIGTIFVHYNGTYHSDNFEGISWYLKKNQPSLKILTIATVEQEDISKLEKENYTKADFILVVDKDVTKTY
ncbi:ChaN family lipoprotein [Flavobacterium sp.]|jgi:uncharacterized iron-regulated protein|uniref:ChaN family lipoprotein n=1 Tax=Flavobacterium sp. TaxID=239 RepID=UPI0037C10EBB